MKWLVIIISLFFLSESNIAKTWIGSDEGNPMLAEKRCKNHYLHRTNEWVDDNSQCKQKPLKNLTEREKTLLERKLKDRNEKKDRILKNINNAESSASNFFTVYCWELRKAYLSIRKTECQLGLPESKLYEYSRAS